MWYFICGTNEALTMQASADGAAFAAYRPLSASFNAMKHRNIVSLIAISIVISCVIWIYLNLKGKEKYDYCRKEMSFTYTVVTFDKEIISFLSEVENKWACKDNTTSGPYSEGMKLNGMIPSIENLIYILNYPLPEWSWFSSNEHATKLGLIKSVLLPISVDKSIHLSDQCFSKLYAARLARGLRGFRAAYTLATWAPRV